jgi:hypothetical protein
MRTGFLESRFFVRFEALFAGSRDSILIRSSIPFKANRVANRTHTTLWKQLFHFYSFNQDRFMESYHKRSNVETIFSMIKAKFGDGLRSKAVTAQKNEALCKVLAHNLCCVIQSISELGIEPTFWEGAA